MSEIFPLEMRAISISLFYAAGTALGGFVGPPLFGAMIESGSREALFGAYAFAAVLMLLPPSSRSSSAWMRSAGRSKRFARRWGVIPTGAVNRRGARASARTARGQSRCPAPRRR